MSCLGARSYPSCPPIPKHTLVPAEQTLVRSKHNLFYNVYSYQHRLCLKIYVSVCQIDALQNVPRYSLYRAVCKGAWWSVHFTRRWGERKFVFSDQIFSNILYCSTSPPISNALDTDTHTPFTEHIFDQAAGDRHSYCYYFMSLCCLQFACMVCLACIAECKPLLRVSLAKSRFTVDHQLQTNQNLESHQ